ADIGGFGSLLSFYLTWIRAFNRLSVFIAFFALLALLILLGRACSRSSRPVAWLSTSLVLLLLLGLFDQTSKSFVPDYALLKRICESDAEFVRQMEEHLPEGAMIFQLPYTPFPEPRPVGKMDDYEFFRPYLHSQKLRWSYGAVKGRAADTWQLDIAQ